VHLEAKFLGVLQSKINNDWLIGANLKASVLPRNSHIIR